tara:strand:- start:968 stop:2137 length:1170 start_codon:yes stop_codon:yes gene_type:complete
MKISIVGAGYVGLSLAVLLSQKDHVTLIDINEDKVKLINNRVPPFKDDYIENFFKDKKLLLNATSDFSQCSDSSFVIIATPTNYNEETGFFDTKIVENSIDKILSYNSDCCIVIKSTVPIGFTKKINEKHLSNRIIFSPEFLQEGTALLNNLYPSRIIIGDRSKDAKVFGNLLLKSALNKNDLKIIYVGSNEAESIKLFSNTYLAMRVAFFNELDTFASDNELNTKDIIKGVSSDKRIGNFYNNPSFGYGGYCLPKDSKQLKINFRNVPQKLISAVIDSNKIRAEYISKIILKKKPKIIGIYRLVMKSNSDNFKNSSVLNVINYLKKYENVDIIVYEPLVDGKSYLNLNVYQNLDDFILKSDIIIANRFSNELTDVENKIFTRDLFGDN